MLACHEFHVTHNNQAPITNNHFRSLQCSVRAQQINPNTPGRQRGNKAPVLSVKLPLCASLCPLYTSLAPVMHPSAHTLFCCVSMDSCVDCATLLFPSQKFPFSRREVQSHTKNNYPKTTTKISSRYARASTVRCHLASGRTPRRDLTSHIPSRPSPHDALLGLPLAPDWVELAVLEGVLVLLVVDEAPRASVRARPVRCAVTFSVTVGSCMRCAAALAWLCSFCTSWSSSITVADANFFSLLQRLSSSDSARFGQYLSMCPSSSQ